MTTSDVLQFNAATNELTCAGKWDINHLATIKQQLKHVALVHKGSSATLIVDGGAITHMDSAGAYALLKWEHQQANDRSGKKIAIKYANFAENTQRLMQLIAHDFDFKQKPPIIKAHGFFYRSGKAFHDLLLQSKLYFAFLGMLTIDFFRLLRNGRYLRFSAISHTIYQCGYQALPIIALLSFMIGIVMTYQMGLQLKNYGANIFIVDLLGLSILREFAPLLTAIMVAGRTGSAFTAELGMMKLNQEIDALNTLGVTPAELLLLPRIFGLLIALPLLTVWADMFGIVGGMIMANNMLQITWYDFLTRFPTVIPLKTLLIGLGKTPVFAFIIATVGCFQGMQVKDNADSVGRNTTKSVVISIFLIILADALFSIIFSNLKL